MKYMNMKRFGSIAMASALALSLAAPAFAANTSTITGAFEAVDLSVTVSQTGTALINPYGLPVNLTHTEGSGNNATTSIDGTISGEQITTAAPLTIVNASSVALAVSATVTGEATGNAVLVSDLSTGVTTGENANTPKNIVARFEAFPAPGIDGEIIANLTSTTDNDKYAAQAALNEAFAALKSEDAVLTAPVLEAGDDGNGTAATGTLVLREGDVSDPDAPVAQDGSVAFFRLAGEVVKNPTDAWTAANSTATPPVVADGFEATIAFTFEPSEYVGTVQLSAVESVAVGSTAKINVTLPTGVKAEYDTIKWTSSKTANVTVVDGTKKPTAPATAVDTVTGTVSGVKSGTSKSLITVEFVGDDGITYRGTTEVKCG